MFEADGETTGRFKADLFEEFSVHYRDFARLMDQFLPDPKALAYADRLTRLTKIRAYARATYLRQDTTIDWADISAKVKKLIDARIDAEVRELMKPVSVLDPQFEQKIAELPHEVAKASVMEHALRAQISERLAENPVFYEKLSEQLERVTAEMRRLAIDAAAAIQLMWPIYHQALSVADIAVQQGMSEVDFAAYELLEQFSLEGAERSNHVRDEGADYVLPENDTGQSGEPRKALDVRLKDAALAIERIMKEAQTIVDWQHKEDAQRLMRRDIKRELRGLNGISEERLNELAANMVEIARRRLAQ